MPDQQLPNLVQYVAALGPTAVAASVGYVAWKQWATAEKKLKFDLFDKRLKVYNAHSRLLLMISLYGEVSPRDYDSFLRDIDGAEFLFKNELLRQIETIRDMAGNAMSARERYKTSPQHPLRDKLIDGEEAVLRHLQENGAKILALFRPDMSLA